MATETELLREVIKVNGGACDDLPDNLKSTLLKKLLDVCSAGGGGSPSGSGGTCSWNDLKDKPFGSEITEGLLEFNGDLTGREIFQMSPAQHCVKMSDKTLTEADVIGQTVTFYDQGEIRESVVSEELTAIQALDENNYLFSINARASVGIVNAILCVKGDLSSVGVPMTEGTWFMSVNDPTFRMYTVSLSGLTGVVETVKKIDLKYLPDTTFYNGTVCYYVDRSPGSSGINYIYNGYNCDEDTKVTRNELTQAMGKTVVLIDAQASHEIQYTATSIDLSDENLYGQVVIVYTNENGVNAHIYYTAEG